MLDELRQHLGDAIDAAPVPVAVCGKLVALRPEPLVELAHGLAIDPRAERLGEDLRLRRAGLFRKRVRLLGKIELMPRLHEAEYRAAVRGCIRLRCRPEPPFHRSLRGLTPCMSIGSLRLRRSWVRVGPPARAAAGGHTPHGSRR